MASESVSAIVPVLDEETAIGDVVRGLLAEGLSHVIVVDGNSRDATVARAREAGASVIVEPRRGYGRAMISGLAALPPGTTIVLFFDGDGSDRTDLVPAVLAPLFDGRADFVMGSRLAGEREAGSLGVAQIVAGHVAGVLLRLFYGARFTDMSPFRALRIETLAALGMQDETFGWNLEMQMRVAAGRLRIVEVAVGQRRRRGGRSKVSSNPREALRAAWVIAMTFFRLARTLRRAPSPAPVVA